MKKIKKLLCILLCFVLISAFFAGCKANENDNNNDTPAGNVVIRYLNFKPEITAAYEKISKEYEAETGGKVMSKRLLLKWQQMKRLRFFR